MIDESRSLIDTSGVKDRFDPAILRALSQSTVKDHQSNPSLIRVDPSHFKLLSTKVALENFFPFDSNRRRSSTVIREPSNQSKLIVSTRGSIESLLPICIQARDRSGHVFSLTQSMKDAWLTHCQWLGKQANGIRIIAFAEKLVDAPVEFL